MPTQPPLPEAKPISPGRSLLLFGAIAGMLVVFYCLMPPTGKEVSPPLGSDQHQPALPPKNVPMGYTLQVGDRLEFVFTSDGSLTLGAEAGQAPEALKINGTTHFRALVYASTATGWLVGFESEEATLTTQSGAASAESILPPDFSGSAIFAKLDKSGRLTDVRAPLALSAAARNIWRDILAKWQVILPEMTAKKWTRVEEDGTGIYTAQYLLTPAGIDKGKTRYLRVNGANTALLAAYQVTGLAHIEFDGFPRKVTGTEKVELGGVPGVPTTRSEGAYSLMLTSLTHGALLAAPNLSQYTSFAWAAEFGPTSVPPENLGDFEQNLHDLRAAIANGAYGTADEIRLAANLIEQLKKDNTLPDQLLDTLRGENVPEQLASAIMGILGASGTAAAQYDLLAVASSEDWSQNLRQFALYAMVQAADPVPEADAALKALYAQGKGDLSGSALLVLAALGNKVAGTDAGRFQQISDVIAGVMASPNLSLNDLIVALDAMGNLGPATVPEAVAQAARSENELVREKAVASLARTKTDAALAIVVNAIANDPATDVQVAGVKTLAAMQGPAAVPDLTTIAANGKTSAARREALTQLSNLAPANPAVNTVITAAAQTDPSPEVRDYASKLLGNAASVDPNPAQ